MDEQDIEPNKTPKKNIVYQQEKESIKGPLENQPFEGFYVPKNLASEDVRDSYDNPHVISLTREGTLANLGTLQGK